MPNYDLSGLYARTAGGKAQPAPAPTVTPSSGGNRYDLSGLYTRTSKPAPNPLSDLDQKVLKSFQTLPAAARGDTLKRLQIAGKAGDAGAQHKLTYLIPVATKNAPKEQNFADNSLSGRAYRVSQVLQNQIPGLLGEGTAGGDAVRDPNGKVIGVQGGHQETSTEAAIRAVQARLLVAGGVEAKGASAPFAIAKAAGKAGAAGVASGTLEGIKPSSTAGKTAGQIAKNTALSALQGGATAAVLGGGGRVLEELGRAKVARPPTAPTAPDVVHTLNKKIAARGLLTSISERPKLTDTLNRNIEAPTSVDPTTRTLLVNRPVLQGDLDHLAAGKGIELPDGSVLRKAPGESNQSVQGKYLDHLVKFEESHVKNATIGDVQGLRQGTTTGRAFDERAITAAKTGKVLPLGQGRTVGEATTSLAAPLKSEAGSIGSPKVKQDTTAAAKEFQDKIISGVPKGSRVETAKGKLAQTASKVRSELLDRYSPIKQLSDTYRQATGKELPVENDPYALARLHAGTPDIAGAKVDELGKIIREAPDVQALKEAGVARRILTDRSGIENPISKETAQARLDELKAKLGDAGYAKTQAAVDKVIAYHDQMLSYLKDNGIISQEAFDAIKAKNQNYFSKFDVVDHLLENSSGFRAGKSFNVAKQDLIKSQKGTTKAIADPIEATIRQTARAVDLVERNRVSQALYAIKGDLGDLVKDVTDGNVPPGYEKVSFFKDGSKTDIAVPADVGEAFKNLNSRQADLVIKGMSRFSSVFRKAATSLNVGFALVSNPIRDAQTLALNTQHISLVKLPLAWMDGFAEAIRKGPAYREFLANGGGQSGLFMKDAGEVTKTAKALTQTAAERIGHTVINPKQLFGIIPAIEKVGEKTELAPRLAEFKAARRAGESPKQAAFDARNVTVDFSQAGHVGQVLNQWVPFLNARLQGNLKNLEAIKRDPLHAGQVAMAVLAPAVAGTYYWNHKKFPDVYNQIPQYVKDSNFVIVYGDRKDAGGNFTQVVKIPKSDMGRVFGNPLEAFLGHLYKNGTQGLGQVATEALSALSPVDFAKDGKPSIGTITGNALPPVAKAPIEAATNYSFFRQGPLVNQTLSRLPNSEQVTGSTSKAAQAIGKLTGQSPIKVDNTINDLAPGVTKQTSNLGGSITGRVVGAPATQTANSFYDTLSKVTPERNLASKKVNDALRGGSVEDARKVAAAYNKRVDQAFAGTNKQYGKYYDQDMKDALKGAYLTLTDRGIKQRQAKIKKG